MARPITIHIDEQALLHNVARVRKYAPTQRIIAMIKANAYGHGLQRMTKILAASVDAFGVACIEEALKIRQVDQLTPIILMEGFFQASELALAEQNNLEFVIHHPEQLKLFLSTAIDTPIRIWLKVNTGMHRLGFSTTQFKMAYQQLLANPNVIKPLKLMTHFARADECEHDMTAEQSALFYQLTDGLQAERSLANSAAILAWPQTHADWVRPGLMLYGVSPFADQWGLEFGLKPVMTLQSKLIAINDCLAGGCVGYGSTWQSDKHTRIGVVAVGYGDGYPRNVGHGTPVLVNQKMVPLVGRVSMDILTVDLGIDTVAQVGDEVILWGEGLPVEQIAKSAGMIPYELLCNVKQR